MAKPNQVVGAYCRISSDAEGLEYGVERQREDCEALIDRRGWTLGDVYTDNDVGASAQSQNKPRPEFDRMLEDLRSGAIVGVVAVSQTRLTRRPAEFEAFLNEFPNVLLAFHVGDFDMTTADGKLFGRFFAAQAAHETDLMSERIKRANRQAAEAGRPHMGGALPYGFMPDRITHEPTEAATIREVVDRVLAGEPMSRIADDLFDRGVRSKNGRPITVQTWKQILRGGRVAGLREHEGMTYKAVWEPIIDEATWLAVAAELDSRKGNAERPTIRNLSSGLLVCSLCKSKLIAGTRGGRRMPDGTRARSPYYRCRGGVWGGCGGVSIAASPVDDLVRTAVFARVLATKLPKAQEEGSAGGATAADLLKTQRQVEKLESDFYSGDVSIPERRFRALHAKLSDQVTVLERQLAAASSHTTLRDVPGDAEGLAAMWDAKDISWRRAVTQAVIASVEVAPASQRGRYQNYSSRLAVSFV